ncbi:unnamed protein product [Allacma fusca]|uniref:RNA helicase n=1 Tax=Allacma fusca TaxID=39272 RepID=A0A8J2JZF9_9HEXA|nr:unnamed protein product [Allacma fusca]
MGYVHTWEVYGANDNITAHKYRIRSNWIMSGRSHDFDDDFTLSNKKGKGKKAQGSKSSTSHQSHSTVSGGKGKNPKKGGKSSSRKHGSNSQKENREDRKSELRNRPQIFLTVEKKASISHVLDQLTAKVYDEDKNANKVAARDFMQKYSSNVAANSAASKARNPGDSLAELFSEKPDPNLDKQLVADRNKKASDIRHTHMQHYRRSLPAYDCTVDIIDIINKNQIVVICGETGSGKTTQVCQYILDDAIDKGRGSTCKILCTQPRRISAISVAERVAEERGESVGLSVGYSIRLEARLPSRPAGTISFVTTGVVFQYLKEDPDLSRLSMIIVDEVHERDILTDFLLAILKDLVTRRSDLKVILMSATLNSKKFSKYFNNCPVFTIPGLLYPVTEYYLEDVITRTKFTIQPSRNRVQFSGSKSGSNHKSKYALEFDKFIQPFARKLEHAKTYPLETTRQLRKPETEDLNLDLIQALIELICQEDKDNGAILVFMPGWDTISGLVKQLQNCGKFHYSKYSIIPLHSLVPTVNQREIFNKPPPGKRKIIISTNIAETSITIDDVVHVIDTGKIKMNNFDVKKNMETLDVEWTSLANSKQRKGRAGRVREGYCYHLYTKAREAELEEFKKPEVLRKRLEEVILQIKMLKLGSARTFLNKLMDKPSEDAVTLGIERLISLHALDFEENLTPLGFHLAHLPMDPQTGKMILFGAIFSCVDPIFSIAASLTFKDAFYIPMGQERKVDQVRKELSDGTRSDHMSNLSMLINLKNQFATYLHRMKFLPSTYYKEDECNRNSSNVGIITAVTAAGLYPNVAQVKMKGKKNPYPLVYTEEDGQVHLHPKSVNSKELTFECPFLVYHMKLKSSMIFLHDTTMVSPFPLLFFGGSLQWNREKGYGGTIVIDNGRIRFGCMENQVFKIVDSLRTELDKFLEHKISNPGPTNWADLSKEGLLLKAIIQLITTEYKMLMNTDDDDLNTSTEEDDD